MTNQMEKIPGKIVGRTKEIPGTIPRPGTEVVYISDNGNSDFAEQFERLTRDVKPRQAKRGAKNAQRCRLWLPDGTLLHPLRYHGDLEGWRSDIEVGAKQHGHLLAKIDGPNVIISDGRVVPLEDCRAEFER